MRTRRHLLLFNPLRGIEKFTYHFSQAARGFFPVPHVLNALSTTNKELFDKGAERCHLLFWLLKVVAIQWP